MRLAPDEVQVSGASGPGTAQSIPSRRIAKIFVAEIASKLALGLSHILITRGLSIPDFSRFSFLYASAFITVNVSGVALNRAIMVQSAKGQGSKRSLAAGAALTSISSLLLLAVLALTGQYRLGEILAVGVFAVSYLLLDFLRSLHQSEMRFREYSLLEVTRATLITVVTVVAVAMSSRAGGETHSATVLILWQGIAMAAMVLPWILWVRRARIAWQPAAIWSGWRKQLDSEIGALFLYFAAVGVFGQVEVFVLKRFGTEMDLAVFSAAFRYYSLLLLATGATSAVLLPLSQRVDSADSFLRLLAGGRRFFLLLAALVVVSAPVLFLFAPLLGLQKYPGFFPVYCVLCVASIQAAFLSPHIGALMKLKQYRFLDVLVYVSAASSVIACVIFVRSFGAIGAAVSYCAANLAMNSIASHRARRMARRVAVTTVGP